MLKHGRIERNPAPDISVGSDSAEMIPSSPSAPMSFSAMLSDTFSLTTPGMQALSGMEPVTSSPAGVTSTGTAISQDARSSALDNIDNNMVLVLIFLAIV